MKAWQTFRLSSWITGLDVVAASEGALTGNIGNKGHGGDARHNDYPKIMKSYVNEAIDGSCKLMSSECITHEDTLTPRLLFTY